MESTRLQAIEALFHAALEVEHQQRDAFLRARCADDDALRREVEVLLAAHETVGTFIESPIATLDDQLFEPEEPDRLVGQVIGHWEILKRIGSGGMGAVYLARRADSQYEKQVAIKLIKRGMDTEAMLRRFRNERQILAGLDHPNIARLLDGDTTADGLPYFVMEYVEGMPIDDYCDRHALGVTERLQLFRQACAAVSYAHRHAVIHRDLKTSNILVGEDGVPKLLDFGIARLLQAGDADEASVTLLGQRVLTPDYASPEHIRGEPVTTASDVYSLGVVLYRLLAGQLPYRLKAMPPEELARTVSHTEPQRPSAVAGATSERRLRGDLDNIVLMALRKEPERRYSSVEQFSEDIRRHLENVPVLARRDTLAYRAAKFVQRNKAATAAGALVVLSLVVGIVMTSWQAHRARTQEAIALAEKARAEHRFDEVRRLARSVIFDYHDAIKDLAGATAIRERLVQDGLAYLDSLASEASGDAELQRELAAAYDRVGDVRGEYYAAASLGDPIGAMDSYLKALRIRESLAAAAPDDLQNRRELAASYRKVGVQLIETSEAGRGREYLRQAIATYEQLAADRPEDPEIRQDLASAYNSLGLALEDTGDPVAAQALHRKAMALREALVAAAPEDEKLRRSLVITHINLGRALALGGDFQGGLASNQKARATCEMLLAANPSNADYHRLLAITYQNEGDYRAILHDFDGALASFHEKLALDEQALAGDPRNVVARNDAAYTRKRMGDLLAKKGRYAEALSNYRIAAEFGGSGDAAPDDHYYQYGIILNRAGIGEMEARLGDRAAALAEISRALNHLEKISVDPSSGARSSLRGQVYMRVGDIHAALGASKDVDPAERRQHWRNARGLYVRSLDVWQDMQKRGILTAEDRTKPQDVTAAIARCDASLRDLDS
ncbi:MAG TPA: protein kinase [Steroidobacteraceae bacterium]|nr:protein kinase [Steroidobacteraceae bacterium]